MLARTSLLLLAAATPALAQFDHDLEKVTSGRLGSPLNLQVSNAPGGQILLFVVSSNAGPTPLALIDPTDPRVLSVGTDLLGAMTVAVTSPSGTASYSLPLPNDPTINAIVLHWQTVTLTLATPFFGELGNSVVTQTGLPDTGVQAPDALATARAFGTGIVDRNNNAGAGDVLVVGGGTGTLTAATGLATSERWDFRRMDVVPGPSMSVARALHLAVRLNDGRVLVIGGVDATGATLASC
jgi:hypothetical protein